MTPGRWLVGSFAAGVLVTAVPTVIVARSSGSPGILDTERVERAIEQSSFAQRGARVQAGCPSGVRRKKGLRFTCTAFAARGSTRFVVDQLDNSGRVHYEAP